MRRYETMSETYIHLQKEAEIVENLLTKIEKAKSKILEIQKKDRWLHYVSDDFYDLPQAVMPDFWDMVKTIDEADKYF